MASSKSPWLFISSDVRFGYQFVGPGCEPAGGFRFTRPSARTAHCVIPRFAGGVVDPCGGLRWAILAKTRYW